uniref:Peptidase S74 domain-containing protein n=1 Tax=viral metagenome TaxID=1070528 RepID=A0A6C0AJK7_9ZZZZ
MSAPGGVTATTILTGGPGSYAISYSWTAATTPAAQSYTVTLNSIIWGVTAAVVGPTNYTSPPAPASYTNTVTGGSYQLVVVAYAGASQTGASSVFTSTQASVYNPYGGPQGVQGYQGIQGGQGATGPTGQQGLQGLQGIMQINNYTVANQITTTSTDTAHLNANSGLTWNGSTLNIGGNITGVTSINNSTIGGVVMSNGSLCNSTTAFGLTITGQSTGVNVPTLTVNAPSVSGGSGYTISAGGSNSIGGVTLNGGAITATNGLAMGTSSITGVTTISAGTGSSSIGGVTLNGGAITATNGLAMGTSSITGVTTISAGTGSSSIGGVTLNGGAITGSLTGNCSGSSGSCTGNAATATSAAGLSNGALTVTVTGTTGTNINTLTVNAPATAACNAIYTTGTMYAYDFTASSDRRLKTDIVTLSNALDIVKNMRGVYFTRIGQTKRSVGVIAQEVEEVLPEVVHGDDTKSVSYGNIVGLLIEAVKELAEKMKV